MKYYPLVPLLLASLLVPLLTPSALTAASFNPNFIISDEELQDWQSLGRAEINQFLRAKGSFLSDYITEDTEGNRRRAGEIIYRAARQYAISPKYLLVKLQKEQSLVSDPDPTQRQIDWATGYGVCDSCDTNDPALQKYKGFAHQVDSAAGIMRWYYDNVKKENWIKRPNTEYKIDNTPVVPANFATAFLYTYTPHLHGNQNFWKLWSSWFNQSYPNGTLIKGLETPTVYLVEDGKKRPIASMSVLASRYNPNLIVAVPADHLARYPEGRAINFPNYSVLRAGDTYYLLDDDTLRPFAAAGLVKDFGYHPDEIVIIGTEEVAAYPLGKPVTTDSQYPAGRLIKLAQTGAMYFIKDGIYYPLTDPAIAEVRFPKQKPEPGTAQDLSGLTHGGLMTFPDGTLMGVKLTGKIFAIEAGKRRHITSEEVFTALGYKWNNVVWVSELTADIHLPGEPVYLNKNPEASATPPAAPQSQLPVPDIAKPAAATETPAGSNLLYYTAPASGPAVFPETGKMIATAPSAATSEGPGFQTPIDAFLVASYQNGATAILAGKNIDVPRPLASFTKVMTAERLFAEGINLHEASTFVPEKHTAPYQHLFRITAGEQVKNSDLLYSLLVSSLNTPARMLAQAVSPDESAFVKRMNETARGWGLSKTYFTDTSGYDLGNQSTAREYLTVFVKAFANPEIRRFLATKQYEYEEVTDLDGKPRHSDDNSNRLVLQNNLPYTILASKTGYLYESGYGLAMVIERRTDGRQFIIITLGNPDYASRYSEPEKLANWAAATF